MSDPEAEGVASLLNDMGGQIPCYTEALACLDCERMFRHGAECCYCGSRSLENIAALLNRNATDRSAQNGPDE